MQENAPKRIVICAKDVMNITGRKERAARKMLADIRKKFDKKPGEFITIDDFCEHTRLKKEMVIVFIKY